MSARVDAVVAAAADALRPELLEVRGLAATLDRLARIGHAAHPTLTVDLADWARHVARHLPPGEIASYLGDIHAGDLHFALACIRGNETALAQLGARLRAVAGQALANVERGPVQVDDLLQDVLTKLLVSETGSGKLVTYSGRGALDGWLRVTLARAALNAVRDRRRDAHRAGVVEAPAAVAGDDPQLGALRARCGPAVEQAIEDSIAALPDAERTLLRLHIVDGLSIDDLAVLYRVHRATVARRIARVRSHLFDVVRERTAVALGLGEEELTSLMGAMMSAVHLTLRGLLHPRAESSR
jgi:RNA polymerase sigma-70 factor (ECF subfamily)